MKRIVIFVLLVLIAAVAGVVVRSASRGTVAEIRELVTHHNTDVREQIRQSYELSPGARVELAGLNGSVNIETSETNKAEVFIERTASSQEALDRRKVIIEADANSLRIHGEKGDGTFITRIFGASAGERVTLKLPRQIALSAKGVNGAFVTSDIDGAVEIAGINGRATFKGINGNMVVGLKRLDQDGVTLKGINGNIELKLASDVNADFDARGMNGRVVSDLPNVEIDKNRRGRYSARIGSGGAGITAKGINGNVRFTRSDL
jgi:DUF4097 and DUF4098 domain-containing protein YvlB